MLQRKVSDKVVIGVSVLALLVVIMLMIFVGNMIKNWQIVLVPMLAGSLLLLGNRREYMQLFLTRKATPALLNAIIGLALISFALGAALPVIGLLFYLIGFVLFLVALPMALGRSSAVGFYRNWGKSVSGVFRRKAAPSQTTVNYQNPTPPTINQAQQPQYDPTTIEQDPPRREPEGRGIPRPLPRPQF